MIGSRYAATLLCVSGQAFFSGFSFTAACFLFCNPLLGFLGANEEMWDYTKSYVLILAAGTAIASALRQGILLIPLLYLMNGLFQLEGLALAYPVADGISILITGMMALHYYRKISVLLCEKPEK